jgi:hypothetical protein
MPCARRSPSSCLKALTVSTRDSIACHPCRTAAVVTDASGRQPLGDPLLSLKNERKRLASCVACQRRHAACSLTAARVRRAVRRRHTACSRVTALDRSRIGQTAPCKCATYGCILCRPGPHSKRTCLVAELVTRGFLVTRNAPSRALRGLVWVRYFPLRLYVHTYKTLTQCEYSVVQIGSVGGGMSCQCIPPICTALYSH